jgi:hypothetical protein
MIGTFLEKYGRAETEHPDFGTGIIKMGADVPIPPRARSAAAPEGTPPRRIREGKNALAPPCPVRGPEAGTPRIFLIKLYNSGVNRIKNDTGNKLQWCATEILNSSGKNHLIWHRQKIMG